MMWLVTLGVAVAGELPVVLPRVDGQLYRPPVDGTQLMWTNSAGTINEGWDTSPRAALHFTNRPYRIGRNNLVGAAVQTNLIVATSYDRVQLAADIPVTLGARGALISEGSIGAADLGIDLRTTLLDPAVSAVGVAVRGRLSLPTGTLPGLSTEAIAGEVSADAEARLTERLLVAVNLGHRMAPEVDVLGTPIGSQLLWRVGAGARVLEGLGVSVDLGGRATYAALGDPRGTPVEALAGMWARLGAGWRLHAAAGRGLTEGIGDSRGRGVLMVTFEPPPAPEEELLVEPSVPAPVQRPTPDEPAPVARLVPGRILLDGATLKVGFAPTDDVLGQVVQELEGRTYIDEIRFMSDPDGRTPEQIRVALTEAGWSGTADVVIEPAE
ncbi:MAG: hypothetical protein KTR31_07070 [Myxococcales bacterium]|nr:hypothetical protein [Myxococcales bacterium]